MLPDLVVGYIDMKWAEPVFTDRTVYNQAAKALLNLETTPINFADAAEKVSNWRASHRYPLHALTMSLRGRVYGVDPDAVVVQRAKRMASIIPKLSRMRLTQIQDIGGCRAVVRNLGNLNAVHALYMKSAGKKDSRRPYLDGDPDNYIATPKRDGYRGIHYVFRYRSDLRKYKCFNEMKIEIQLRTRAQHAWATALEVVDMFTGQNLKTDIDKNQADPDWKRFFALMSTVIATKEGCPAVPETPDNPKKLVAELRAVCARLGAIQKLEGYGTAVNHIFQQKSKRGGEYLITLDAKERSLHMQLYVGKEIKNIDSDYLEAEKKYLDRPHIQVVQVKAKSLEDFKRGYPNYDIDTSAFVKTLNEALA